MDTTKDRMKILENNRIINGVSKFTKITPDVFVKFLPKQNQDGYLHIRKDCCLEFDLKYDQDNNKTVLTLFFDTCDNSISNDKVRKYDYARVCICNNMERHKIGEFSCEREQSIDSVIEKSETIQSIVKDLTDLNSNLVRQEKSDLFKYLFQYHKKFLFLKNLRRDDEFDVIDQPINYDDEEQGICKKGFVSYDYTIAYFEKFTKSKDSHERFRIIDNVLSFENPIEEYKDKINSDRLNQADQAIFIDRIRKSLSIENEYNTYNNKLFLKSKITNSTQLAETTKLLLIRQLDPIEITKTDKENLINDIKNITNLTDRDKLDLVWEIEHKTHIPDIIYEIQHSGKLTKIDKENLVNKINNLTKLTEADKESLINKIHSIELHKKTELNKKYKSLLIKLINPILDEEGKKNLMKKLQSYGKLNEKEKLFLINEISETNIFKKISTINKSEISSIYNFDPFKNLDEIDKLILLSELKKFELTKANKEILIDNLNKIMLTYNKTLTNPDLSIKRTIYNLESDILKHHKISDCSFALNCHIWNERLDQLKMKNDLIFDLGSFSLNFYSIEKNEDIEKGILDEFNKICLTEMVKNVITNINAEGRLIITGKNANKGEEYVTYDGLIIRDPRQLKTESLKGAIKRMDQDCQIGLKLNK